MHGGRKVGLTDTKLLGLIHTDANNSREQFVRTRSPLHTDAIKLRSAYATFSHKYCKMKAHFWSIVH